MVLQELCGVEEGTEIKSVTIGEASEIIKKSGSLKNNDTGFNELYEAQFVEGIVKYHLDNDVTEMANAGYFFMDIAPRDSECAKVLSDNDFPCEPLRIKNSTGGGFNKMFKSIEAMQKAVNELGVMYYKVWIS